MRFAPAFPGSRRSRVASRPALAFVLCFVCARVASAQVEVTDAELRSRCEAVTRALPGIASAGGASRASVVLRASVRARTLRFASRPHAAVLAEDCPGIDSVRVIERRNLPDPIVPGTTYRDVHVVIEIFAHLSARCPWRAGADTSGSMPALACPPVAADSTRSAPPSAPPPRR